MMAAFQKPILDIKIFENISHKKELDLDREHDYAGKVIYYGLDVKKENQGTLTDQLDNLDFNIQEQIQQVKDSVVKICQQKLKEHKCEGVVPGTFMVCGEGDYQYCSDACLEIAKRVNI